MEFYAVRSFFSILSGYERIEMRSGDVWVSPSGDPYYWCARFTNGRHIPLPILEQPGFGPQGLAIRIAGLLKPLTVEKALEESSILQELCPACGQKMVLFKEDQPFLRYAGLKDAPTPQTVRTFKCPDCWDLYACITQCDACGARGPWWGCHHTASCPS